MIYFNNENDTSVAYDLITDILEYVTQQNDLTISDEHKYQNIVSYLENMKAAYNIDWEEDSDEY